MRYSTETLAIVFLVASLLLWAAGSYLMSITVVIPQNSSIPNALCCGLDYRPYWAIYPFLFLASVVAGISSVLSVLTAVRSRIIARRKRPASEPNPDRKQSNF